jgi:hypothetical protein
MHLVVLAVLASELCGAERLSRVDEDIPLFHHQANLIGYLVQAASHLQRAGLAEISLAGDAFDRRFGV